MADRGPAAAAARTIAALIDLVLPAECAGCGGGDGSLRLAILGICAGCLRVLAVPPGPTRPTPAPPGLPVCLTVGPYEGARRELILGYKERGRRGLVAPLGDAIATVVLAGLAAGFGGAGEDPPGRWVILVPVPATAAAVRARQGDHMLRLARRAARVLRGCGWHPVLARPLRARPKADSAHLDRRARAVAARTAFEVRPGPVSVLRTAAAGGAAVVLLDDVITTGHTLAALAGRLAAEAVPVAFAATVAATRLRHPARSAGTRPGHLSRRCVFPGDASFPAMRLPRGDDGNPGTR